MAASGRFARAGTPIRPFTESTSLETGGPFRVSRNPMYAGVAAVLLGTALGLGSAAALLVVPAFLGWIHARFVVHEERMLEEAFGEAYRAYAGRVRRSVWAAVPAARPPAHPLRSAARPVHVPLVPGAVPPASVAFHPPRMDAHRRNAMRGTMRRIGMRARFTERDWAGVACGIVLGLVWLLGGCDPSAGRAQELAGAAGGGEAAAGSRHVTEWPAYGNDAGGSRYAHLDGIDRSNVAELRVAWSVSTGDASHDPGEEQEGACGDCHTGDAKFETTPILAEGRLFVSTPLNRILALDPATGEELWRFDPHVRTNVQRAEGFVSRGVSYWSGGGEGACASRVFLGTIEARLHAVDARTGRPCADFGEAGTVRLDEGVGEVQDGQYAVTSPPAVVGDVLVVGSAIGDNRRVGVERGVVRGYDVRSGTLLWAWDPIPRSPSDPGWDDWTPEAAARTGAANAWAPLSADPERDMVFVPTGSAAPDFYGGERPGDNRFANSVVALRASTGEVLWDFQVVHHDVWDYDVASQPTLVDVPRDGRDVPAVIVATKQGFLFVLDRQTGEPLFPVEERPVPQSGVPGEALSPTQPFPVLPEPLHPFGLDPEEVFGVGPGDEAACRDQVAALRWEGVFTPPSTEGTLMFPGYAGGMNWGGVAVDPERRLVIVNHMRLPTWVRLHERPEGATWGSQLGTPYHMTRGMLMGPSGLPCAPPPWGKLTAIDLVTGARVWDVPFGRIPQLEGVPGSEAWGSPNVGGALVTAGGLVFIGASMDDALRAFDVETGEELWRAPLPAGGQATPMTYAVDGRQFVVIAAGGHGSAGTTIGDRVVAFALR